MLDLAPKIDEAAAFLRSRWNTAPRVGIILGTGLGGLAKQIEVEARLPYEEIPHFLRSTATSHAGHLVCGRLQGVPIVAMEGRFHAYEGYPMKLATLPVRVMKALGAGLLIASNACGGLNPQYKAGDIMVMDDHINLMGVNPLIGINDDKLGPRFPDMCEPYDLRLVDKALEIARSQNFVCHRGGNVHRARGDCGGALRPALHGPFDHHRHVPCRRPQTGQYRRDHRHRQRSRVETAGDC
jgi:purine-nucleoside phosphorylase